MKTHNKVFITVGFSLVLPKLLYSILICIAYFGERWQRKISSDFPLSHASAKHLHMFVSSFVQKHAATDKLLLKSLLAHPTGFKMWAYDTEEDI